MRSRTSPPVIPLVVARKLMASRSQQSRAKADPDFLAVVTADLEAVGAPAAVSLIHRDAAVVTSLGATAVPIEQQAMDVHDPIDSFVVRRLTPLSQGPPLEDGMDTPIAVGRQLGNHRLDRRHQIAVRDWRPANPPLRPLLHTLDQVGPRYPDHLRHGLHREPSFGGNGGSRRRFFEPAACSIASLRISASNVFFPSSRCSSRTWLCK